LSFWVWAQWAELEEQVQTKGRVIASSRSQTVQAVDGGVLRSLHVREGSIVKEGQVLASLDPVRFESRVEEMRAQKLSLLARSARLDAELTDKALVFPPAVQRQLQLVEEQEALYMRRREQLEQAQSAIRRSLALANAELNSIQQLANSGDAGTSEVLRAKREVSDLRGQLTNELNQYREQAQAEKAKAFSELEQVSEVLKQRQEALTATEIRAPMDGNVKSISVFTHGAVLAPGDEIMQIVPTGEPMLVEARLSSVDVAFIRRGMPANIKLEAYDFSIYGSIKGQVNYISPDVIDKNLGRDEDPYYRVLITLNKYTRPQSEGLEIIPGMSATTEIITGSRTVAQYVLKPLLRGSAAALTER
jgi:adhesin transport system membrane fusion protein